MKKRLLSLLLAFILLLGLLPASIFPTAAAPAEPALFAPNTDPATAQDTKLGISSIGLGTFEALGFDTNSALLEQQASDSRKPYGDGGVSLITQSEMLVTFGVLNGGTSNNAAYAYDCASGMKFTERAQTKIYGIAMRSVAFDPLGSGKADHVAYLYIENAVKGTNGKVNAGTSKISLRIVDYGSSDDFSQTGTVFKNITLAYLPFEVYPENAGAWLSLAAGNFDGDAKGEEELAVYVPLGGETSSGSIDIYDVSTNRTKQKLYAEKKTSYNLLHSSYYTYFYDLRYQIPKIQIPDLQVTMVDTSVRESAGTGVLSDNWQLQYYIPAVSLESISQPGDDYDDLCFAFSPTLRGNNADSWNGKKINPQKPIDAMTNVCFWIDPMGEGSKVTPREEMRWNWREDYSISTSDSSANWETMYFGSAAAGDLDADGINEVVVAGYCREEKNQSDTDADAWKISKDEFLATYFIYNPADKTYSLAEQGASWVSIEPGDYSNASRLGDGIYNTFGAKDMTFTPLDVTCFAERGGDYGESVSIGGIVCTLGEAGQPCEQTPSTSLSSYSFDYGAFASRYAIPAEYLHTDQGLAVTNRLFTESVAANVDGNPLGQEKLIYSYLTKKKGENKYTAFFGLIGQRVANEGAESQIGNKSGDTRLLDGIRHSFRNITKEERYAPVTVAAPDVDDDSLLLRHSGKPNDYYFSDPHILAVLQAAPYFQDLDYGDTGETVITNTEGSSKETEHGFTTGISVWAGIHVDMPNIASTTTKLSVTGDFSRTYGSGKSTSYSLSFTTGGEDSVALIMTPYVRYYYQVYIPKTGTWEPYIMDMPQTPRPSIITVDKFDEVAELQDWQSIRGGGENDPPVLTSVAGYPVTYDSGSSGKDNYLGGRPVTGSSGVELPDDFIRVGSGNSSSVTQVISTEKTDTINMSWGVTTTLEQEQTKAIALYGGSFSAGYTGGSSVTTYTGSEFVGEVPSVPTAYPDYSFSWKFGTWTDSLTIMGQEQTFPVVGYLVKDVTALPSRPQNLHVSAASENSVTLKWQQNWDVKVNDHYVLYRIQKGVYYPLANLPAASETGVYNDVDGWLSYTDTDCDPDSEYHYAVRAFSNVNGRYKASTYSPVVTGYTAPTGANIPKIDGTKLSTSDLQVQVTPAAGGKPEVYQWEIYDPEDGGWKEITLTGYNTKTLQLGYADKTRLYRCRVSQMVNNTVYVVYSDALDPSSVPLLTPPLDASMQKIGVRNAAKTSGGSVEMSGPVGEEETKYEVVTRTGASEQRLIAVYDNKEYSVFEINEGALSGYYLSRENPLDACDEYFTVSAADTALLSSVRSATQEAPNEEARVALTAAPTCISEPIIEPIGSGTMTMNDYLTLLDYPTGIQGDLTFEIPIDESIDCRKNIGYLIIGDRQQSVDIYGFKLPFNTIWTTDEGGGIFESFTGEPDARNWPSEARTGLLRQTTTLYNKFANGDAVLYREMASGLLYYGGTTLAHAYKLNRRTTLANFNADALLPVSVWAVYSWVELVPKFQTIASAEPVQLQVSYSGADVVPSGTIEFEIVNQSNGSVQYIPAILTDGAAQVNWTPEDAGQYVASYRYRGDQNYAPTNETIGSYTAFRAGKRIVVTGLVDGKAEISTPVNLALNWEVTDSDGSVSFEKVKGKLPAVSELKLFLDNIEPLSSAPAWNYLKLSEDGTYYIFTPETVGNYDYQGTYYEDSKSYSFRMRIAVEKHLLQITTNRITLEFDAAREQPLIKDVLKDALVFHGDVWTDAEKAKFTPCLPDLFPQLSTQEYVAQFDTLRLPAGIDVGEYDIEVHYDPYDTALRPLWATYMLHIAREKLAIVGDRVPVVITPVANGMVAVVADDVMSVSSGNHLLRGSNLRFTAAPEAGFMLKHWLINDEIYQSPQTRTATNTASLTLELPLEQAVRVQPVFTEYYPSVNFNVSEQAGEGDGSIAAYYDSVGGAPIQNGAQVTHGATLVFCAAPDEGSIIKHWSLNGLPLKNPDGSLYCGTSYTISDAREDVQLMVAFEEAGQPLTVTVQSVNEEGAPSTGGVVTVSPQSETDTYPRGTPLTLTATPNTGSNIHAWRLYAEDGSYTDLQGSRDTLVIYNLQADMDIRVVFKNPPNTDYLLRLGDGITAVSANGITMTDGESYPAYTNMSLTAATGEHEELARWLINGEPLTDADGNLVTDNPLAFDRFYGETEIAAELRSMPCVTWDAPNGGSLRLSDGTNEYASGAYLPTGTVLTISATPDECRELRALLVNDTPLASGSSFPLEGDTTLSAEFVAVHTLTEVPAKPAACLTDGNLAYYSCAVCERLFADAQASEETALATVVLPATSHSPQTDAAVEPTCTTTGLSEGSHCSVCNEVLIAQQTVEKAAHTPQTDAAVEPTCTATGLSEGSHCAVCNEILSAQQVLDKAAHTPQTDAAVEPTCTTTGLSEGSHCAVCNEILSAQQVIETLPHTPLSDAAIAPTCTESGKTEGSHCTVCNTVLVAQSKIAPMGHFPVTDAAIAPTCTESGKTEGSHCVLCSTVLIAQTELDALGHSWDEGILIAKPTTDAEGEQRFTCTRCGETKTEIIPKRSACDGGDACPGRQFTDMPAADNWAHDGIDFALENGWFEGTSATTFTPDGSMTRAMLITVLWRLDGKPAATQGNPFTDVPDKCWYTEAVLWAAENQIANGIGNGRFDPDSKLTREQFAVILYRYAVKKGYSSTGVSDLSNYPDCLDASDWAREALSWANAEGLINGSDGMLLPTGNVSRAQVAVILMRYVNNIVK